MLCQCADQNTNVGNAMLPVGVEGHNNLGANVALVTEISDNPMQTPPFA